MRTWLLGLLLAGGVASAEPVVWIVPAPGDEEPTVNPFVGMCLRDALKDYGITGVMAWDVSDSDSVATHMLPMTHLIIETSDGPTYAFATVLLDVNDPGRYVTQFLYSSGTDFKSMKSACRDMAKDISETVGSKKK